MIGLLSGACCLAAIAIGTPALAASLPVDCRAAHDQVDRVICTSPESLALEAEITALYGRGMATFSGEDRHHLAQSQLAYIHKRKSCDWASHQSAHPGSAVDECVHAMMEVRLRSRRRVVDLGRY